MTNHSKTTMMPTFAPSARNMALSASHALAEVLRGNNRQNAKPPIIATMPPKAADSAPDTPENQALTAARTTVMTICQPKMIRKGLATEPVFAIFN